jgi:hypothetical protein
MTVDEIIKREAISMGRPCELIDYAHLEEDVIAVVYSVEPFVFGDYRQEQIRAVFYAGDTQLSSSIVRTDGRPGG